jgi:hypothetical protein
MTEREAITRVHVIAKDLAALRSALGACRSTVAGGIQAGKDGRVGVDAYLRQDQLERLRSAPVEVRVVEDATAVGAERQAQVGEGNRFQDGSLPRGLGELSGGSK